MAHPIRPESYIKMDNFYTVTVYEKGAEVVRMYETLLGKDGFRKGMDLYFQRHDGQAVTTDDFFAAMADANARRLSTRSTRGTRRPGPPRSTSTTAYDATKKTFALTCTQSIPDTPGQTNKTPTLMPIAVGLVGPDGVDMPLTLEGEDVRDADAAPETTKSLRLEEASKTFTFTNVAEKPTPSILRTFPPR